MSFKTPATGKLQTIDRRVPARSGRRSYVLDSTAYDQLIAAGLDPDTVAEAELANRAHCCREYDDQERLIQQITTAHPITRTEYPKQCASTT